MDHSNPRVPPPHGEMHEDDNSIRSIAQNQPGFPDNTVQVNLAQQPHPSNIAQSHLPHPGAAEVAQSNMDQSCLSAGSTESSRQFTNMPAQHPILPQDRSSLVPQPDHKQLDQNIQTPLIDEYRQQEYNIKQHLVYQPVDPRQALPPTQPQSTSTTVPKTSKTKPETKLNHPPELTTDKQKVKDSIEDLEGRRNILHQQQLQNSGAVGFQYQPPKPQVPSGSSESSATSSSSGTSSGISSGASSLATRAPVPPHPARALQLPQAHNYEELDVIGTGAYGTVYRGRDLTDQGRFVALKKIKITLTDDGVPVSAVREISLLKQLENFKHPNVVRLLDICHGRLERENRLSLVLVFEYVEMDLGAYIKKVPSPGLEPARIRNLMHQILSGVDFLHSNRIIHRDLKPQNILVDRCDRVKIADFGLARIYDYNMKLTTMVVTLWYRAPEVLLSNSYATPVDVWSCACIFAELFRKRPLFEGQNEGEQLQRIFEVIGTPSERDWPNDVALCISHFRRNHPKPLPDVVPEISSDAADLLQSMLAFVPDTRASARQSLCHPYFEGVSVGSCLELIELDTSSSSGVTSKNSGSIVSVSSKTTAENVSSTTAASAVHTAVSSDQAGGSGVSSMVVDDLLLTPPHVTRQLQQQKQQQQQEQQQQHQSMPLGVTPDQGSDENNPNSSNISTSVAQSTLNKSLNQLSSVTSTTFSSPTTTTTTTGSSASNISSTGDRS